MKICIFHHLALSVQKTLAFLCQNNRLLT
jgi:hypothetical protein